MWKKIENYYWTLKYLKKSQLVHLAENRLRRRKKAVTLADAPEAVRLPLWMEELDACPDYLERFSVEEILTGQVTLLHESGRPGGRDWKDASRPHLWNFNLHYLEFLIPLAAAYRKERKERYYICFRDYCRRWIRDNREGTGDGWHPYTISLRLTSLWICMDGFGRILQEDRIFAKELNDSMYAQYLHLQKNLELHLLGNHYFENLKAVLLGSIAFREPEVLHRYRKKLQEEIREQILQDGVHYERSLMYHKIILEDLMRMVKALGIQEEPDEEWLCVLKQMADAAYSLEEGMGRTPLFNDAGDNVARPLHSLILGLREQFKIVPEEKECFPAAGYYCLKNEEIKLILDAGEMAPDYMPGHGHCDGLSFELSFMGRPLFVNSGTGQYQGPLRPYMRSTAAHNTVVIDGKEQSVCWGEHRVGRRMTQASAVYKDGWVKGSLKTCAGKRQLRTIGLGKGRAVIRDRVKGQAAAYLHLAPEYEYVRREAYVLVRKREGEPILKIWTEPGDTVCIHREGEICTYAPEFGKTEQIQVLEVRWDGSGSVHELRMDFQIQK